MGASDEWMAKALTDKTYKEAFKKSTDKIRKTIYNLPDYNLPEVDKKQIKRQKRKSQTTYRSTKGSGSIGGY